MSRLSRSAKTYEAQYFKKPASGPVFLWAIIMLSQFPGTIETNRLIIKRPAMSDAAALVPIAGDFAVIENMSGIPHPYALGDAKDWIEKAADPSHNVGVYRGIYLKPNALIGTVGLYRHDTGGHEIGYMLAKTHWGQGYGTEAVRAFMGHVPTGVDVIAEYTEQNPASAAVLGKCGFVQTGESYWDDCPYTHTKKRCFKMKYA